jgi:hypothetical protein
VLVSGYSIASNVSGHHAFNAYRATGEKQKISFAAYAEGIRITNFTNDVDRIVALGPDIKALSLPNITN